MKIAVPADIKAKTTKCDKCFDCLLNEQHVYCKVKACVDGAVHFIECRDNEPCSYKMAFGRGYLCTCPIRKYIYNTYKI